MYTIHKHAHHEPALHIVLVDAGTVGSSPSIAKLLFRAVCIVDHQPGSIFGGSSWLIGQYLMAQAQHGCTHTVINTHTHTKPHTPDNSTLLVDPMSFVPGDDDVPHPLGCLAQQHSAVLSPSQTQGGFARFEFSCNRMLLLLMVMTLMMVPLPGQFLGHRGMIDGSAALRRLLTFIAYAAPAACGN